MTMPVLFLLLFIAGFLRMANAWQSGSRTARKPPASGQHKGNRPVNRSAADGQQNANPSPSPSPSPSEAKASGASAVEGATGRLVTPPRPLRTGKIATFPVSIALRGYPVPPAFWARAKEDNVKRRGFVSGSAALAAASFVSPLFVAPAFAAASVKPIS